MALVYSINDELESIRSSATYEWAFAIFVANFTIQVYRLVAQLTTFTFDIFKLRYGVDLFWPLTTDDLRPYTHYFIEQDETVLKLLESLVLSLGAFYGASSLLRYTIVGLALYAIIFFIHSVISILGLFFVVDHKIRIITLEFLTWFATVAIEVSAVVMVSILLTYYSLMLGSDNS